MFPIRCTIPACTNMCVNQLWNAAWAGVSQKDCSHQEICWPPAISSPLRTASPRSGARVCNPQRRAGKGSNHSFGRFSWNRQTKLWVDPYSRVELRHSTFGPFRYIPPMNTELLTMAKALPLPERIELAEALWDSITQDGDEPPLTPAQAAEIDRRLEEHRRNPQSAIPGNRSKLISTGPAHFASPPCLRTNRRHPG